LEILAKNYFFPNSDGFFEGIPNVTINPDDLLWVVKSFLQDYNKLMNSEKENEHYVLMPINYLLYLFKFDGIINKCDDTGRTGSIKYFFDNEYGTRGYRPNYKKRIPLLGKLIFLSN